MLVKKYFLNITTIFIICFAIRLIVAIPGIKSPETLLFRPDTIFYLNPALSLYHNMQYNESLNSIEKETFRPPLFALLLSFFFHLTKVNYSHTVFFLCLISALTCFPIFYSCKILYDKNAGIYSTLFFVFNITSIAHAPLFLSDTFFSLLIACHLYFFIQFSKEKKIKSILLSILFLILATYTRRVSIYLILPESLLIFFTNKILLKKRILISLSFIIISISSILPWMYRNYINGAGFSFDSNYIPFFLYNSAFVEAKIMNKNTNEIRNIREKEFIDIFNSNPLKFKTKESQLKYKMNHVKKIFNMYPLEFILIHFNPLNAMILLPDAATFFEILGITHTGKNTLNVLHYKGLIAAVKNYFGDKIYLPFLIMPLIIITFIMYFGILYHFYFLILQKNYFLIFYYIFFIGVFLILAGPILMPRYHLPLLPFFCISGGFFLSKTAFNDDKKFLLI